MKIENIRPGIYKAHDGSSTLFGSIVDHEGDRWFEYSPRRRMHLKSSLKIGWTFTRLVPAEEVEKAWLEAYQIDLIGGGGPAMQRCWELSRAKRISEGVE